jgi:signal transduction histidine kinase
MNMSFQSVRVDAVIKDVITRMHSRYVSQVVELEHPKVIPVIRGDPRRLAQVFENLLANAAKYAPESLVSIKILKQIDGIKLLFLDQGPGIPDMYLPMIFDRFFRIPDQSQSVHGSGLGLFICKQIIQAHSGKIDVTSKVGIGTEISIFLPYQSIENGE